jgi:nucleotide sugar dehydrogenase
MKVAVFGAGYVGLVTGACFAELGHEVVVRDVVEAKVDALRAGVVPIHEPGLDEILARNAERLTFTTDVAKAVDGADVVYIAVGTPPTYSGDADLSAVWTVVDELPDTDRRIVVAMKSTVPVGTGSAVRHRLDDRGLANVGYVSNPEFTAEGTAVQDFLHPDRIVIGSFAAADGDVVERLHDGIDAPIVRSDVPSAEMVKLAANAALVTRISFINEIANVCEATGADVMTVAKGIGLDRRIGPSFLRAGIGFGGSCFPKDSLALKQLAANSRSTSFRSGASSGSSSGGSARSAASASRSSVSRSSRGRTTCARLRASCSPVGSSPRAPTSRRGIPSRTGPPTSTASRSPSRRWTRSTAPTAQSSSPSGRSSASSTGRPPASGCAAT